VSFAHSRLSQSLTEIAREARAEAAPSGWYEWFGGRGNSMRMDNERFYRALKLAQKESIGV
jgi:hypothetical protein